MKPTKPIVCLHVFQPIPGRCGATPVAIANLILALICTLVTSGCGHPAAKIQPLRPEAVILAFGDSLTQGKGALESDSYPVVLSELTTYRVINAGRSGELSGAGLERLPSLLNEHKPALVVVCHGGNDMLQKRNREETVANLEAMIGIIRNSGADVILLGVPEPGIFVNTAAFYAELARRHGIPCDDRTVAEIMSDASLKSDYTHPNALGYRRMGEVVAQLIEESQAS